MVKILKIVDENQLADVLKKSKFDTPCLLIDPSFVFQNKVTAYKIRVFGKEENFGKKSKKIRLENVLGSMFFVSHIWKKFKDYALKTKNHFVFF